MNVPIRRPLFNRRPESNLYRMFFWVILILGGIWLIRQVQQGDIKPLFTATATPTRTANSYALEGDAQFTAGELDASIKAYREAVRVDPNNAEVWAKLARIQTYSTSLLVAEDAIRARLAEALESANKAVELAPDDSSVYAIRAFVEDWNANKDLWCTQEELLLTESCDKVDRFLIDAGLDAVQALHLDNTNTLALAFYAEILLDEQNWSGAEQNIQQALERDPSLMDVHRVNAYVQESLGQYDLAIQSYNRAIEIAPKLTFLYLQAGANYRVLGFRNANEDAATILFEKSLEYFDKAARINEQLGVKDPQPYLSIARTYSQMPAAEYFAAARNVQKALEFDPVNADVYGQLGIVYFKSRNYEGSIPALKCAIRGCDEETSCQARFGTSCADAGEPGVRVTGLKLSANTVVYYYTYGSVLAALNRPQLNYCPEAQTVFNEIMAQFGSDPDIAGIVSEGRFICTKSTPTPQGAATETPSALYTPTPTSSP